MRVLTIVGVLAACGAGLLEAQRAHQFEFGAFGSFTRYDRTFNLDYGIGGGARLGYFITDRLSVEGDVGYQNPSAQIGAASAQLYRGSASLVLNFAMGDRSLVYVLGGYSRDDFEKTAPYRFTDNGVHGAIGERFFVSDRIALRLEARGIYTPKTNASFGTEWVAHAVGSLGVSVFTGGGRWEELEQAVSPPPSPEEAAGAPADSDRDGVPDSRDTCPGTPDGTRVNSRGCTREPPARRFRDSDQRRRSWSNQWYWGGQGGTFTYRTLLQGFAIDPIAGGHWLITANRTALYVAYEQAWFLTDASTVIADPGSTGTPTIPAGFREVTFGDMRRLMMGVLAFPMQQWIEPYLGGGFALMQVLDPIVDCSTCVSLGEVAEAQDRAEDASSKAFFWVMGGIQISLSRLALFGQYFATSSSQRFLIDGNTHTLQAGLRYSLGTSKEGITERN